MNPKLKRILSFLFIVLSITAVFFIAFSNQDLTNAWDAIKQMNVFWLGAIFLCWLAYTFFDGMNYWCYLNHQGFKISIGRAVNVALIGFYYSNITPGATGGQPMQVNSMRKAGIPVGYGTMAVTIRFITNQTVVSVLALVLFLLNRSFVYQQLEGAIWFVRIGWLINFAAVPLVLLAAFKLNWIQRLAELLIGWLEKIHLVRN
ncbi:MAG: flippase-like domain-containing protein, partial [Clostridia bacterium]|nr:flippase-like domain-containing protein [Clostridia bacterium]